MLRNIHGHKGFPLPEGELGHLSTQQEAWLNDVFPHQLVTEVIGFSKWVGRGAERKGASSPTSKSHTGRARDVKGGQPAPNTQTGSAAHGQPSCPKLRCWEKDRCIYAASPWSTKLQQKSFKKRRPCSNNPGEHQHLAGWCYVTRTCKWPVQQLAMQLPASLRHLLLPLRMTDAEEQKLF